MNRHLDMLGHEIVAGDVITYPIASGSSSAEMTFADVEAIEDIIKLPNGDWTLHSYRNRHNPTTYMPFGKYQYDPHDRRNRTFIPDMDRAYVLRVYKLGEFYSYRTPKLTILKNIDRVIRITDIMGDDLRRELDEQREKRQRALDGLPV